MSRTKQGGRTPTMYEEWKEADRRVGELRADDALAADQREDPDPRDTLLTEQKLARADEPCIAVPTCDRERCMRWQPCPPCALTFNPEGRAPEVDAEADIVGDDGEYWDHADCWCNGWEELLPDLGDMTDAGDDLLSCDSCASAEHDDCNPGRTP